ncbi:polyprenyl synthetase family protein [Actinomadura sp. HBU206391]|uniref:polyprenyl synthetase family protein n=1 Tax=Actinomadura sp. HBU206391 TaxID=2731692 RepID=UPI00164F073B|nr:polyprenyl synthetase family protein [Actinomadura sp. HBU206391]MBC6461260.1 polyprenyl synthetase family protein [Actinomadura sp. HBU206391]
MCSSRIRKEIDEALFAFISRQRPGLLVIHDDLAPMVSALESLVAGGKRLRPSFCYWGWRGAGGGNDPTIMAAAASLELLQASALIHDDVMDASDTRRGQPSVHRRFQAMHEGAAWPGSAESFGAGAAILLGDLSLAWSSMMYETSGLPEETLRRGRATYDLMRTEVMCGQYLDLLEQARGAGVPGHVPAAAGAAGARTPAHGAVDRALRVVEFKSAKYSVERPVHLGAAMAGADGETIGALSRYGLPLGIAFQLRDDVLGVFGDPAETGKPAGDDLREGKRTVLVALALERATPAQADVVRVRLGDPALDVAGVEELRSIIVDTGGLDACEAMIAKYAADAHIALDSAPVTDEAKVALAELAVAATARRG